MRTTATHYAASAAAYSNLAAAILDGSTPACLGDLRFVNDVNSLRVQNELADICARCEVFAACLAWRRATVSEQRAGYIAGWQTLIRTKNPNPTKQGD